MAFIALAGNSEQFVFREMATKRTDKAPEPEVRTLLYDPSLDSFNPFRNTEQKGSCSVQRSFNENRFSE
jgi:hypothetical protein